MTIHELLAAAGLTANDEIPIWDAEATGEPTKKITAQQLAAAVVALANLVTGVKGDKESNYRHGDVNLTPANVGAVSKSGDTMTGDLNITKASAIVSVTDSTKGHTLQLGSWNNGTQGLWSLGYHDGSDYVSSPAWLIERDKTGKVIVNNHYNKDEIDARFSDFSILHVEKTVSIPSGVDGITETTIDLTNYIPDGMRIYDAVSVWLGSYRIPYITNDGVVKTWLSTVSSKRIVIKNLASDWTNYTLYATLLIYPIS